MFVPDLWGSTFDEASEMSKYKLLFKYEIDINCVKQILYDNIKITLK